MGLLQEMKNSFETPEVIFHDFSQKRKNIESNKICCFFEGKQDYSYYNIRISLLSKKEVEPFICYGKEELLKIYDMIQTSTKNGVENSLFFIDKDFDDSISKSNLYETPCYSVENFYISLDAFTKTLFGEFSPNTYVDKKTLDVETDLIKQYYLKQKEEFYESVLLLNSWYSLQKKKSKNQRKEARPDLSNVSDLKTVNIKFTKNKIASDYMIDELKVLTPRYIQVEMNELEEEMTKLRSNLDISIRGKYIVEFLVKIYSILSTDANSDLEIFKHKRKVKLPISRDTILSTLSQYADTPKCLIYHLEKYS